MYIYFNHVCFATGSGGFFILTQKNKRSHEFNKTLL
nr:MAG TPA: hypothetical protein [Bacteriophage sp.]